VRVTIDAGGLYAICASADGCSRMYDLASGALLCRAGGHGEMATAAVVSADGRQLVSVSGDGCMCVWQLPARLAADSAAAAGRLAQEQRQRQGGPALEGTPDRQKKAGESRRAAPPAARPAALRRAAPSWTAGAC
jgi:hypothetical protein